MLWVSYLQCVCRKRNVKFCRRQPRDAQIQPSNLTNQTERTDIFNAVSNRRTSALLHSKREKSSELRFVLLQRYERSKTFERSIPKSEHQPLCPKINKEEDLHQNNSNHSCYVFQIKWQYTDVLRSERDQLKTISTFISIFNFHSSLFGSSRAAGLLNFVFSNTGFCIL